MGYNVDYQNIFNTQNFNEFKHNLIKETVKVTEWFRTEQFSTQDGISGFEVEAWLVDHYGKPLPINEIFIKRLNNPMVVSELGLFNIEINMPYLPLYGNVFKKINKELEQLLQSCQKIAKELDAKVILIGILPSVTIEDLSLTNMSLPGRFRSINEQVLLRRNGKPIRLYIKGHSELLKLLHPSIMLEAANTSLQTHLQVTTKNAAALFNASLIISAPMVAIAANAPILFGKRLWQETRIPLFEQCIPLYGGDCFNNYKYKRVSFGNNYVNHSILELFIENLVYYPPLLPIKIEPQHDFMLPHLCLHNGTIWRWNRPLIGFNKNDNIPHLRIEHRVMSSGPSIPDIVANAALYYGLVYGLAKIQNQFGRIASFTQCKNNFYAAAKYGLEAEIIWYGNKVIIKNLLLEQLIPLAKRQLLELSIDFDDIQTYMEIVTNRTRSGNTGAIWQLNFFNNCGYDIQSMMLEYISNQKSGKPVHEWNN